MYARARKSKLARAAGTQRFHRSDETGLTLIELLIVIVVLGILAAVVIFSLGGVTADAAVSACEANAKTTEIAVQAYEAQGDGTPPASLVALTQGANPYLEFVPSSSYYAISLVNGSVMVAAPPSATPVSASVAGACSGAGSGAGDTPTSTTSTTAPNATTTSTTTTTTTSTTLPSNGVTVTPSSSNYSNYGGQERLSFANTSSITSLSVTITVSSTPGVAYGSETTSFPGGYVTAGDATSSNGVITYTFDLTGGTIWADYPSGIVYAQFGGTGNAHNFGDDTWSVTSTSGGIRSTLSGTF
jgi:general secretion pathway protein G